jgi:SAM-dependent methyltransferase
MNANSFTSHHQAGAAFDTLAEQYDGIFTNSLIGRAQRTAVWNVLSRTFQAGGHVLELNCGTGEDALFLGQRGISVFGCDASERMIAVANERRSSEGPELPVRFEMLPTERIGDARTFGPFDGALSNFAGLNCVADIGAVARQLATMLVPGARFLLCLCNRFCVWETLWFLTRGSAGRAFRRWNGRSTARLGQLAVEVRYPSVRSLCRLLSPYFVLRSLRGVGITVPPSYLEHLARSYPRLLSRLEAIDAVISAWPFARILGDHVLLSFERVPI